MTDDDAVRGWDRSAFWFPSADRKGLLLLVTILLIGLHFGELFGIHTSEAFLFGAIPVSVAYHGSLIVVYSLWIYVLYRNWPDMPTREEELDMEGDA